MGKFNMVVDRSRDNESVVEANAKYLCIVIEVSSP